MQLWESRVGMSNAANFAAAYLAASPGRQGSSEASLRLLEALLQ